MLHGQATSWKLEDAIQLFYVGNEAGVAGPPSVPSPPRTNEQINSSTDHTSKYVYKPFGCLFLPHYWSSIISFLTFV